MSSFIAAGTAYANHGQPMIPFYIYYSMFGFQRVGDSIWAAADSKAKGFLLGATAGRTTLNGEGLQHQDGHSLLFATSVPTLLSYDPAFGYEVAVIVHDGLKRMYQDNEDVFYYLALYNENYAMAAMPEGVEQGILSGMYKYNVGTEGKVKAQILASGPMVLQALKAQVILAEKYGVSVDIWSVTSYKSLRTDALRTSRWNMLNPEKEPKKCYIETTLANEKGPFLSVSDNVKLLADGIAPWVPGGLTTLGTDGFGRSDTRASLRRFFEVDTESIVIGTLYALSKQGKVDKKVVAQAIKDLNYNPDKKFPVLV